LSKLERKTKQEQTKSANKKGDVGKSDEGSCEDAEKRLKRIQQRMAQHTNAKWKGLRAEVKEGQLWVSGSEPHMRFKNYVCASKSGKWERQGTTYMPVDGWKAGAWETNAQVQLPGVTKTAKQKFLKSATKVISHMSYEATGNVATGGPCQGL
jgi:hypothetical protein